MQPIISAGEPSRLPLMGPLQRPSSKAISTTRVLLEENEVIMQILHDDKFERSGEPNLQLVTRLHRNLIYLAIRADLENASLHEV